MKTLTLNRLVRCATRIPAIFLLCYLAPGGAGQTIDQIVRQGQGLCGTKYFGTIACLIPNAIGPAIFATSVAINRPLVPDPGLPTGVSVLFSALTAALPVPSPVSGLSYVYDSTAGAFVPQSDTFGPLYAERAETIGQNRFSLGFAFERFAFDRVDKENLHNIPFGTTLSGMPTLENFNLSLDVNRYTIFGDYGLDSKTDIGIGIPFENVRIGLAYNAIVVGTGIPPIVAGGTRNATGIGDVTFQVKRRLFKKKGFGAALLFQVRTPTGNEVNALGAGAFGLKPFLALSYTRHRFSPHVNIGYQFNGRSILAGNVFTGEKRGLPNELTYTAGFDTSPHKRLTLNFDVIGQDLTDAQRLTPISFVGPNGTAIHAVGLAIGSPVILNGAAGFKARVARNLLLDFNVLFRLNKGGVRSELVPLFGASYTL